MLTASIGEDPIPLSSDGALLAAQGLFELSLLFVAIGVASEWRFQPLRPALERLGLRRTVPKDFGLALLTLLVYYIGAALFASLVLQPEQEDIGGQLGVGFVITGFQESAHHSDATARYLPGYYATRALKP